MKEEGYVAGWDGGGTKTECEIRYFTEGERKEDILKRKPVKFYSGALNIVENRGEKQEKTVKELLHFMKGVKGGLSACKMLCIGTAGVSNREIVLRLKEALKKNGYEGELRIVGDDVTAFKGALGGRNGITLVSGTGSICIGFDKLGNKYRAGGYGHLIDDEGSGYSVGREILSAIIREYDGRGEKTFLTQLVFEEFNIKSIEELISYIYSPKNGKKEIAAFSTFLQKGLEKGDRVSKEICNKAVLELYSLVEAVRKRMREESVELVFRGSVLTKCIPIREGLKALIQKENPSTRIIEAEYGAATGACILALEERFGR